MNLLRLADQKSRWFDRGRLVPIGLGLIAFGLVVWTASLDEETRSSAVAYAGLSDHHFAQSDGSVTDAGQVSNTSAVPQITDQLPSTSVTFAQSSFAIADATFATYFGAHGGIASLGYPVTNPFRFLGFRTQIFQRGVLQLAPDGTARLMNLLDPDLMPYTRVNGSTFPDADPQLIALAPNVTDADYTSRMLDFVRANVPDSFAGQPVNFLRTFESSVPCPDPSACDESLRLQSSLDIWGPPTSRAAADPNNPQFIYQRFQRGMMHYDATCACTQGILLGEYFKDLLAGQDLPPDLDEQAHGSPLYGAVARGLADSDFADSGITINADLAPRALAAATTSTEPAFRPLGTGVANADQPAMSAPAFRAAGGGGGGGGGGASTGAIGIVSVGGGGGGASHGGGGGGGGGGNQAAAATATPSPTQPGALQPAITWTPTPTLTSVSSATPTVTPTPTHTPIVGSSPTATVTATATTVTSGQYCSQAIHDKYVVAGPDGRMYPTWHPPVDPVTGCQFGHEHGADPRTSKANQAMPAFGYAGAQMGMTEPHEGFKVFVLNSGDKADDGRTLRADYRIVFHMGTSGVARYTQEFHSVIYDYVAEDGTGRYAHVQGMADTGPSSLDGSTCDLPRKGGKDFSTVGCDDAYEIWGFEFKIMHPADPYQDAQHVRLYLSGSVAAFDPILTRDPANNGRVLYTQTYRGDFEGNNKKMDPLLPAAYYQGCQREAYGGPNFWDNAGKPSVYYTDAMGNVVAGPGPGAIRQEVSAVNATSNEIYKIRHDFCGNGIHAPN